MNIWILCCGEPAAALPTRCTGAQFEAALEALAAGGVRKSDEKTLKGKYRRVLAAPGERARQTAECLLPGTALQEEPLLAPIPHRAFRDSAGERPLWYWLQGARWQARTGSPRQPESLKASAERAEALVERLERAGEDCVLITDESMVPLLLDRLRVRGCCAARSGVGRFRPWERILVTRRDTHCGGCAHNCFLSNPGCDIGRDKARRLNEGRLA